MYDFFAGSRAVRRQHLRATCVDTCVCFYSNLTGTQVASRQNNNFFSSRRLCTSLSDLPSLMRLTILSRKCRGIRPRRTAAKTFKKAFKILPAFCFQKFFQRFAFKKLSNIFQRFAFKNFPAICFQKIFSDLLSKFCQLFSFQKASKNFPAISFQKFSSDLLSKSFQKFSSD